MSILSDMNIATPAFFWFLFSWNNFFYPLILSVLDLKWIYCRQQVYGSCFCIQSASLCLLVVTFNTFIVKIIIDMHVLIGLPRLHSGKKKKKKSLTKQDMQDMWIQSLSQEDLHSSIHPWKSPQTEEPCGLQSMGMQRVGHNWAQTNIHPYIIMLLYSSFLICFCKYMLSFLPFLLYCDILTNFSVVFGFCFLFCVYLL